MRNALPIATLPLLLATATACGQAFTGDDNADTDAGDSTSDSDTTTDGSDTGAEETWGVGGTLTLASDVLTASSPTLETRSPSCVVTADFASAEPLDDLTVDDVVLRLGWTITATPNPDGVCTSDAPTSFTLGIGPTDANLGPAADQLGYSASHAYGLYLKADGGPLFLVGIVGTQAQLDGTEDATTVPPMNDGDYKLVTLFGVPVQP